MAASASAIKAGKAYVEVATKDNTARGLNAVTARFKAFAAGVNGLGASLGGLGLFAGAGGIAAIASGLWAAVKSASAAAETANKFKAVMGEVADEAGRFANEVAKTIGRSVPDVQKAMAAYQAFFVGLGFGKREALGLSKTVQRLALDFASFHNIPDDEAMSRFISALSGSSEVLDQYGINIKAAAIDNELLRLGINKTTQTATEQEKALARLNIIFRSMNDQGAVGDATKTAGSFENRLKALKAATDQLSASIGQTLIPALLPVVTTLTDAANAADRAAKAIGSIGGGKVGDAAKFGVKQALGGLLPGIGIVGMFREGKSAASELATGMEDAATRAKAASTEMRDAIGTALKSLSAGGTTPEWVTELEAAEAKLREAIRDQTLDLAVQAATFGQSAEAVARYKLQMDGATASMLEQYDAQVAILDALRRQKDVGDQLKAAAKGIFDMTRTPTERFEAQLEELDALRRKDLIDQETYARRLEQLERERDDALRRTIDADAIGRAMRELRSIGDGRVAAIERRFVAGFQPSAEQRGQKLWQDKTLKALQDERGLLQRIVDGLNFEAVRI